MMRRWLIVAGASAAAVIAIVLAVAFAPRGTVVLRTSVAALVAVVCVLVVLVLILLLVVVPTARRRSRARLEAARETVAAEQQAAHRRFLARLDHELKNPVTAIRSALAVDGAAPAENVRIASSQAARLGGLTGQLRALSALETREIERAPVDISSIVVEETDAVREEADARGRHREIVTTLQTVPWGLPSVIGDADLLALVVRNVVLNAVKYSSDGARIEVRGSEEDGAVVLEIADTGWGIRSEDMPFVWDELWRASDARAMEGTGLGLSLVRIVVQRHGGDVSLRSQHGTGTSVRVRLPAAPRSMSTFDPEVS